jgi:heat shock protein HslJ
MMRKLLLLVAIVAIGSVACDSTTPSVTPVVAPSVTPSDGPNTPPDDMTGEWQLEHGKVDGAAVPIVKGSDITMSVHVPSITGKSACNSWSGRLSVVGGEIHVTDVISTAMACADDVMASEQAFMRAIGLVRTAQRDGDRLTLRGADVELVFSNLAAAPSADLVGTTWRLESLSSGDTAVSPVGDPVILVLDAGGTFSGSTGCRQFTGSWTEGTGQIVVTTMTMYGECAPDRADQDGRVVDVLGDGFGAQVEGDRLTLTAHGSTLQYVAQTGTGG